MPARLSPTERIRAQIDELFAGGQPLAESSQAGRGRGISFISGFRS